METVDALKEKFPQLISPPSDDICYATQNRQLAVKQMGAEAELVIVVGSRNSSNSKRLVEVAKLAGSREAYLVDFASEIDEAWLQGVTTVGVTSGASVPEVLVEEVLEWLSQRGYGDVELVKAAEESITFSLPKELRRDLREEAAALVAERKGTGSASGTGAAPGTSAE
jgi:4-hydroxy-3-methylbut-2-enyl diphosphate reductase